MALKVPVFGSNRKLLQINKIPSNIQSIGIHSQQRADMGLGAISLPGAHREGFDI